MIETTISAVPCQTLGVLILWLAIFTQGTAQTVQVKSDPLEQIVPEFTVQSETILDAVARLNALYPDFAVCIEHILADRPPAPSPQQRLVAHTFDHQTIHQILDSLLDLDPTYTWSREGGTINIFPRVTLTDTGYVMNRLSPHFQVEGVGSAPQAMYAALAQLPPPKEQLAYLESGSAFSFAKPWTASFTNISLRAILNRIARQLGQTYGWQMSGYKEFRIITFHARLSAPHARQERQHQTPGSEGWFLLDSQP